MHTRSNKRTSDIFDGEIKVADDEHVGWWQIALVKIGVIVALPAFIGGAEIAHAMGFAEGIAAIAVAAFILGLFTALTGGVGAASRMPTSMLTKHVFGVHGSRIVNLILSITLLGWFGVTAAIFGTTLSDITAKTIGSSISSEFCMVLGGILMIGTTIFGFEGLKRVADFLVPFMLVALIIIAIMVGGSAEIVEYKGDGSLKFGLGVSALVGSMVVGTTIFPDIARFARSVNHGCVAGLATYWIGAPTILILATIPSIATGEKDLILIMLGLDLGVSALFLLTCVAWTTNSGNLYSSSLMISSFARSQPFWKIAVVAGAVGVGIAVSGITSYFVPFLIVLGICIPPVAGIYLVDFYIVGRQKYAEGSDAEFKSIDFVAFAAWIAGSGVAFSSSRDLISLSGTPAVDAILVAAGSYWAVKMMFRDRDGSVPCRHRGRLTKI